MVTALAVIAVCMLLLGLTVWIVKRIDDTGGF